MKILARHVLKNAFIPVITVMGLQFGTLLSGAVITETVFARPGIGKLLIDAILSRTSRSSRAGNHIIAWSTC